MNDLEKKSIECIKNMPIEETTYQVARNVVLDYITNLQEKNNKLKNKINQLQEDLTDTEKEWSYWEDRCDEAEERLNKLIDNLELKGDDKDDND